MNILRAALPVVLAVAIAAFSDAAEAKKKKRGADGRVDLTSELPPDVRRLSLGDAAPDFTIKGTDGRSYSLADFAASPLLMVVFLSNHCPYSHAAETRLIPLAKEFAGKGLAVVALLAGRRVPVPTTPVVGCATKWKFKAAEVAAAEARANTEPVVLERATAETIAALVHGESKRLRVVNVWATWCAPCVAEFPGLVALSRRFANRDFELITISMDAPTQEPQVKRFLEKHGAAPSNRLRRQLAADGRTTTHYLYEGASTDALAKAVDSQWPGPLPHTVVIAPDGKVLYRHNGPVDPAKLLDVVLGALGAFYQP